MAVSQARKDFIVRAIDATSGGIRGLTCPFDRTRLLTQYVTDLTVRVVCTAGWLRDGRSHEFSLPISEVEQHFEIQS